MTCLTPDNLSITSSDVSGGLAFRSLCSPFSDLSSSSAAIHSAIKQGSSSNRNWLDDATANSLERRRRRPGPSSRQRCSSLPREKKRCHDTSQQFDIPTHQQSRSHCSTPVSVEDKINWALNHSSDVGYQEEFKSSSGISSTASSSIEIVAQTENYDHPVSAAHLNLTTYPNNGVYSMDHHTNNLYSASETCELELTQALVQTMTELKDLAEVARVIDDVDDEEWLLLFIGELEIHLNDLLRTESKKTTAASAYSEIKQKQTLLSVAEDLVRYLKERCRWTLNQKSSMETESERVVTEDDSTLQRMKTLASSTTIRISSTTEWQNKLSRLALTLDRYLSLLMSNDKTSPGKSIDDKDTTRVSEPSKSSIRRQRIEATNFATKKPLPKPRHQLLNSEYNKTSGVTSHEESPLTFSAGFSSQSFYSYGSPEFIGKQPDNFVSTLETAVDSDNMIEFKVNELNINTTETDFLYRSNDPANTKEDNWDSCSEEKGPSQYRATVCVCPRDISPLVDTETRFCSSFELQCKAKDMMPNHDEIDEDETLNVDELSSRKFVSTCFQSIDDDADNNPKKFEVFTSKTNRQLKRPNDYTRYHERKDLTIIPHHNRAQSFRSSTNLNVKSPENNLVLVTPLNKKQNSEKVKSQKLATYSPSKDDSGPHVSIRKANIDCVSGNGHSGLTHLSQESRGSKQHSAEPVQRVTSSVQCSIVSNETISKSEEKIRKLRESTDLLRRGITEAREERDEKDRKIAILESRSQRLKKNMEVGQMERGSAAVELERMRRLLEQEKKYRDRDMQEMQVKCKKLEEEGERMQRRIYDLQEWIEKLKNEKFQVDEKCKQFEQEKKVLERKLYETTMSLMKEKHHNRKLYVDNLKLEQEVTKWREKERLQDKNKKEKEQKDEIASIMNDVIDAIAEDHDKTNLEELNKLRSSLATAESANIDLLSKNEELQTQLIKGKEEASAATDCFRQEIEYLSNEMSMQRESARLQKEHYDNEASTEENGLEKESLRSQLVYQETLTRTLYAENERLRDERDGLRKELSSIKISDKTNSAEFGCQVEDTTYTKMKAHEFYLQEALRNARRLRDRGGQLQKETLEAARQTRKIDVEIMLQSHR